MAAQELVVSVRYAACLRLEALTAHCGRMHCKQEAYPGPELLLMAMHALVWRRYTSIALFVRPASGALLQQSPPALVFIV